MKSYKEAVQFLACSTYALSLINDPWTRDRLRSRIRGGVNIVSYLFEVESELVMEDVEVEMILGGADLDLGQEE